MTHANYQPNQQQIAEASLASVNHSSGLARGLFVGFMLLSAYVAVTLLSTDALQMLLLTPLVLPIVNVEIDYVGFFVVMPFLYLVIHLNLLIVLAILSRKLVNFNRLLDDLPYPERYALRAQLHAFNFTQRLSGQQRGLLSVILRTLVFVAIILIPIAILLWLQLDFLPVQNHNVWRWQRFVIFIDILCVLYFWLKIMQEGRLIKRPKSWQPKWQDNLFSNYFVFTIAVILVIFLSFVATDNTFDPIEERVAARNAQQALAAKNDDSEEVSNIWQDMKDQLRDWFPNRIADIRQTVLVQNADSIATADINKLSDDRLYIDSHDTAATETATETATTETETAVLDKALLNNIIGLDLRNRMLTSVDLSSKRLPKANLSGATLTFANLVGANLRNANLVRADLIDADLIDADLIDADLIAADLSRADLRYADLRYADLSGADLSFADLSFADLSFADLRDADLSIAYLSGADLSYADLRDADLRDAYLSGADLRGADLSFANLNGADLSDATFECTRIAGANNIELAINPPTQAQNSLPACDEYWQTRDAL